MRVLTNPAEEMWWGVAEACPWATFFHTPAWHKLAESVYSGVEDASVGFVTQNGGKAVLPLLKRRRKRLPLVYDLVSTFAGCYGGVIADFPVSTETERRCYSEVVSPRVLSMRVTGNPFWRGGRIAFGGEARDDFTYVVDLSPGFDAIWKNFRQGHRRATKQGRQSGVYVRLARSMEDFEAYYCAYEDSLKRWGDKASSCYPWKLFLILYEMYNRYKENIRLWLACRKNEILAGALVFYMNNHVVYWHGAAYEKYFDFMPNNVLHADILRHACDSPKKYSYYDFNPSGGHEGVARFKSYFGGTRKDLTNVTARPSFAGRVFKLLRKLPIR